mgnify:CR=1 FL=1
MHAPNTAKTEPPPSTGMAFSKTRFKKGDARKSFSGRLEAPAPSSYAADASRRAKVGNGIGDETATVHLQGPPLLHQRQIAQILRDASVLERELSLRKIEMSATKTNEGSAHMARTVAPAQNVSRRSRRERCPSGHPPYAGLERIHRERPSPGEVPARHRRLRHAIRVSMVAWPALASPQAQYSSIPKALHADVD